MKATKAPKVTHKFEISKTVRHSSHEDDCVILSVFDPVSFVQFLELEMTMEQFGKFVASNGTAMAEGQLSGTEYVGKHKVREDRHIKMPEHISRYTEGWERKLREWMEVNCAEDGWLINNYFGSRDSFYRYDEVEWLKYSVYKYVEKEQA